MVRDGLMGRLRGMGLVIANDFVCAEAQDRTGDTWFFSRSANALAESRLNFRAIAIGSWQRQLVESVAQPRRRLSVGFLDGPPSTVPSRGNSHHLAGLVIFGACHIAPRNGCSNPAAGCLPIPAEKRPDAKDSAEDSVCSPRRIWRHRVARISTRAVCARANFLSPSRMCLDRAEGSYRPAEDTF